MANHAADDAQPPCHRNAEHSNQIPDKSTPNNDSCGSGPAIAAYRTANARIQSVALDSPAVLPAGSGIAVVALFASVVTTPDNVLQRFLRPLQKPILRI